MAFEDLLSVVKSELATVPEERLYSAVMRWRPDNAGTSTGFFMRTANVFPYWVRIGRLILPNILPFELLLFQWTIEPIPDNDQSMKKTKKRAKKKAAIENPQAKELELQRHIRMRLLNFRSKNPFSRLGRRSWPCHLYLKVRPFRPSYFE